LDIHQGGGESVVYIDPEVDESYRVQCGLWNEEKQLGVRIEFDKRELPWLTNWQHFAKNEYVTGIEPGTNPPIGQKAARESNTLTMLGPGEKKKVTVKLTVLAPSNDPNHHDDNFLHLIQE
jgi:hypothetical protein